MSVLIKRVERTVRSPVTQHPTLTIESAVERAALNIAKTNEGVRNKRMAELQAAYDHTNASIAKLIDQQTQNDKAITELAKSCLRYGGHIADASTSSRDGAASIQVLIEEVSSLMQKSSVDYEKKKSLLTKLIYSQQAQLDLLSKIRDTQDSRNSTMAAEVSDLERRSDVRMNEIVAMLNESSGAWEATVKSRDQRGRILTLSFSKQ
jgi:hypothetical protein